LIQFSSVSLFLTCKTQWNNFFQEYTVDLYFLQLWFDPRFNVSDRRFENARVELIGPQLQDLWLPDTIFVNSKRSRFHAITIDNRFLTIYLGSGMIAYHSRITMTASCKMDLRSYPFDTQSCKLAIESCEFKFISTIVSSISRIPCLFPDIFQAHPVSLISLNSLIWRIPCNRESRKHEYRKNVEREDTRINCIPWLVAAQCEVCKIFSHRRRAETWRAY